MNRLILSLLFAFLLNYSASSQTNLDSAYRNEVCKCIDSTIILGPNNDIIADCFELAVYKFEKEFTEEVLRLYGDTTEENAARLGTELAGRAAINLIGECDAYFYLMDSIRYTEFRNLDEDSLKNQLSKLNSPDRKETEGILSQKALLYFQLKSYDSTLVYSDAALNMNGNNTLCLFLKAWAKELKGDYDEAITLYNQVADMTKQQNYYIFSEIAKKKKSR